LRAVLVQPKRVAFLAYLVLARPHAFQPRSSLVALFWPEHDERHARWAVNQALRYLRAELGPDVIRNRGKHAVGVEPSTLWCDANAFEAACDASRWETALELYRGELLPGLHIGGCADFERWVEEERARLHALAARAAWALAERTDDEGDLAAAVHWARRGIALAPHDEAGARRLIRVLDRAGDRAGDLFDVDPAPETQGLLRRVRARTEALPQPERTPAPLATVSRRPRTPRRYAGIAAGAALVGLLGSWAFWHRTTAVSPRVVATGITSDARALQLYREGRDLLSRMTEPAVREGIYRFNQAIGRDSLFAQAYAALAEAYVVLGRVHGSMDPREAFPLARRAAQRALALQDGLAEAHTMLGIYEIYFGWDWAAAERELRRAIRLDPHDPAALEALAFYLTLAGRYDEVPAVLDRAIALNPVDPVLWADAGSHAMLAGRFDDAWDFLARGFELSQSSHLLYLVAGNLHAEMGDTRRAITYLHRADTLSGHQQIIRGRLGYAYALDGDSAAARAILGELKRHAVTREAPAKTASAVAVVHIGLGELDSAFAWLDIAYERRASNLVRVLRTPAGWRLASDPRYVALLNRVGLRPVGRTT
ncbi:MAG: BTAD domain-containing putative transcriptional regulator, partial [Gemmatimonadales bacterium]